MRRIGLVLLGFFLALAVFAGGGRDRGGASDQGQPTTVTLWHTWGAVGSTNKIVLDYLLPELERKYNIKIEDDSTDSASYLIKLPVAYSANEAPDIARGWAGSFMVPFVNGNKLLALDEYLTDDYKAKLLPGVLDLMTYNGKIYGLPMSINTQALYVNRAMFEREGLALPTDWDKLVTAIQHFKSKGITPITLGARTNNQVMFWYEILKLRTAGPEDSYRVLTKEIDYSAPEFLQTAERLKQLFDMGAFPQGAAGLTRDETEVDLYNGVIPMCFQGPWVTTNFYLDTSHVNPDDIEILGFPSWPGAKGKVTDITGGVSDSFYVNAQTRYPKFLADVAQDLMYGLGRGLFLQGSALAAYHVPPAESANLPPLFLKMVDYANAATYMAPDPARIYSGDDVEQYYQNANSFFLGILTPQQFIANMNLINRN